MGLNLEEDLTWVYNDVIASCRNAVVLVLSNGFSIGCLSSVALNLLLPYEQSTEMQNVSYVPGGVHPVDPNGKIVDSDFEVSCCCSTHIQSVLSALLLGPLHQQK